MKSNAMFKFKSEKVLVETDLKINEQFHYVKMAGNDEKTLVAAKFHKPHS
jgi:plastocyanin domain-containing protein